MKLCGCWDKPIIHNSFKMKHKRYISFYLKQQYPLPKTQTSGRLKGKWVLEIYWVSFDGSVFQEHPKNLQKQRKKKQQKDNRQR